MVAMNDGSGLRYSYTADFGLMFYNARWYDPYAPLDQNKKTPSGWESLLAMQSGCGDLNPGPHGPEP